MFRAFRFARGTASEPPTPSSSGTSLNLLDDAIALEQALKAMDLLMDDRIAEAQRLLADGNSTYFKLARGVIAFIEATLGFESEAIKTASEMLNKAENSAYAQRAHAVKAGIRTSSHFSPGLEYSVVYAEAQLLGAITLFLSESVIDTAKALLKLRKAYQTLHEVHTQMKASNIQSNVMNIPTASVSTPVLGEFSETNGNSLRNRPSSASIRTTSSATSSATSSRSKLSKRDDSDDDGILTFESMKNPEIHEKARMFHKARLERYKILNGSSQDEEYISQALSNIDLNNSTGRRAGQEVVDEYIVSAVNACYGILQLVISILPSSVGRVLSIVGFHGSKEDGISLLWHSVESLNIHGAIGLLALLQYYDGPTQVTDIVIPRKSTSGPEEDPDAPLPEGDEILSSPPPAADDHVATKLRLRVALRKALKHFSHGALWQLQEGRMEASRGNLREAIKIMDDTSRGPINMRQVEGLMLFDKTMFIVTLHGFDQAAENFIRLIDLNTWSHMFYTFLSAMCHVELYRQAKDSDPEKAAKHKKLAAEACEKAPTFLGKRKFMAKDMPFDVFALRKLSQWKATAEKNNCHIIDAISTSPIHEIVYFWNGFGRMLPSDLEITMKELGYAGEPGTPYALSPAGESLPKDCIEEVEDEALIRYVLQSVTLRNQGKVEEGYELLKTQVLSKVLIDTPAKGYYPSGLSKAQFLKKNKDPWVPPSAVYEAAIFEWVIGKESNVQRVRDYLDLAASYGDDYELSTRVTLKIKGAISKLEGVGK